ncbi:TPA: hypothetical protein ACH3X2_003696 [Trebouxia sp. C0005]
MPLCLQGQRKDVTGLQGCFFCVLHSEKSHCNAIAIIHERLTSQKSFTWQCLVACCSCSCVLFVATLHTAVHAILIWSGTQQLAVLLHRILRDNLNKAVFYRHGAKNFSGFIAHVCSPLGSQCLRIVVLSLSWRLANGNHDTTVEAFCQHLGGSYDYAPHCWGCCMHRPSLILSLVASAGYFVSPLFLVDACSAFCSSWPFC